MKLADALSGMLRAEEALKSPEGVSNPTYMSLHMARLSQYIGSVEEILAIYEKDLETETGKLLRLYLLEEKVPVTKAEKLVKAQISDQKGQVIYLTRLVGSAWKQVGVIQSRINHLVRESQTTNL